MSHDAGFKPRRYVLGQFADSDALLGATKQLREKGHTKIDTHTLYLVHGIEAALGLGRPKIPTIVLCGALAGMFTAYAMITFMNVVDFPINIGNRPMHGPPANIPITFELAVLFGGLSAFLGFFALARLPEPYHPVFEAESFRRVSIDGFFVSIEVPEGTNPAAVAAEVKAQGSIDVQVVEESER